MGICGAVFVSVSLVVLLVVLPVPLRVAGSIRGGGGFGSHWDSFIRSPVDHDQESGTKWAVLVAGSKGFDNYRHQSDVCHAYQILKKGGLKDENIIVFMYDDIANNNLNTKPGVIINHPKGADVYHGVPKDYTGEYANSENLYAVLLGNKNGVKGGSGKVVNSTKNDRIFLYYSDHGGPGVLGMPHGPFLFAEDFVEVLKKKHMSNSYKEMVLYIEACESGSIFEGMMPSDLNIYVQTASNAEESSFATYCPGMGSSPRELLPCLGDLYSVAWMEDSETHNLKKETIEQQYEKVKDRTSNHNTYAGGSHVMQYGNESITFEKLYLYQGFNPATRNIPPDNDAQEHKEDAAASVDQRNADLFFLWQKYNRMKGRKEESKQLLKQITDTMLHRTHLDGSMDIITAILFGPGNSRSVSFVRRKGRPIVDNWDCLKSMVRVFETHCGSLTQYGMKHMGAFANICNNKISLDVMEETCKAVCENHDMGLWNPMIRGFSA